jgi:hypothetical protein
VTETIETKLLKNGMLKIKMDAVRTRISALSLCSKLRTATIVSVTTGIEYGLVGKIQLNVIGEAL